MRFFGNEFFQAVDGMSHAVVHAYMRACWHYWTHNHCEGLLNDDEYLRRLCRCDSSEWPSVKPIIFGQFFKLDKGLWQQYRAKNEFRVANEQHEINRARAVKASKARWEK
jgi:uncharacterized protein YdaU (DUF1376 family)